MVPVAAGLLTSAVVKIAGDKLSSVLAEQANLVCNFSDDLEDMKDTMQSMAAVLEDAEKQSIKKESVRLWLKRLKDASLDISDMMDEYQDTVDAQATAKMPGMFSCLPAACRKMVLAKKMKTMREKLRKINKQRKSFTLAENIVSQEPQNYDPRETTSVVNEAHVFGRDGDKKKITDHLCASHGKDGTVILPIYGLGGMGKSTLAQLVYNDTQFKQYYDHRVWVYVSQEFDLKKIGTSIISQLPTAGQQNTSNSLQLIQQCLNDLLHGKKILIILDDIWEEDDFKLKDLKGMLDKKGSIVDVIVTTRSESIANKICTNEAYKLQPLEDSLCWDIIKRYSGFEGKSNKGELELIGLDIAKKCGGVALAAQALGYTLRSKDLHGWSEMNNCDIWKESSGVDDSQHMKVLPSLKLSYERMLPILRLCFSYCAIFPKGHDIYEDDLVHQWVALDFIKKPSEGKEYINQLLGMSFLQYSKLISRFRGFQGLRYTMHDLVHDLATSVIGDELTVIDAAKKSNNASKLKYCRYAVLTNYDGQIKLSNIVPKKVRALHFSSSNKLAPHDGSSSVSKSLAPHDGSFSFRKCLRVLDFSECTVMILPSSVGQLNQLRCLIAPQVQNKMFLKSIAQLSKVQYLNLRGSNAMCALPESIPKLSGLVYHCLSDCSGILKSSEESFGGLKSLTDLAMSHCSGITGLPESFAGLQSLTHLDMSWLSGITDLPESFGGLQSLMDLDISNCFRITGLPESFGGLQSLTRLYMPSCSKISDFPKSFGGLQSLMHLDMSRCSRISGLPESFGGLQSLAHLNMSHCSQITGLPESFGGLKSLTHLDISYCSGITVLPGSFGGLQSLTCLDMPRCSGLTSFPESFGKLKSLVNLHMSYCSRIASLPESFGGLQSLTGLDMSRCFRITSFPESFHGLKSLVNLHMSHCSRITDLPKCFGELKFLTYLDMSDCSGITSFPESFGGLRNLKRLDMSYCLRITSLPESFGGLQSLTCLDMSWCSITNVLPESFGRLQNLTRLDMSFCYRITGLPKSFGELQSLTYIDMSRCSKITGLPESFGGLQSLMHLDMSRCSRISGLPESFGGLQSLAHLNMSYCSQITGLPESFGGLKSLTHLNILYCSGITVLPGSFGGLRSLKM